MRVFRITPLREAYTSITRAQKNAQSARFLGLWPNQHWFGVLGLANDALASNTCSRCVWMQGSFGGQALGYVSS